MDEPALTKDDLPTYDAFMFPVLRAVADLGGSATTREIRDRVIETMGVDERWLSVTYEDHDKSVLIDRLDWGRSYVKLGGLLESPKRSLFLLTVRGREVLAMTEADALAVLAGIRREVRRRKRPTDSVSVTTTPEDDPGEPGDSEDEDLIDSTWQEDLLRRLHELTPAAFERFCIHVLKSYGLELIRVGGSGDEGIDAIGTAPLSPILSARVAVQAKRYDPANAIGREPVALFQRDAQAKGAERAVFIKLGRFTAAATRAAVQATPTVDLIDGERLCRLVEEQSIGVTMQPVVNRSWFDRFEES